MHEKNESIWPRYRFWQPYHGEHKPGARDSKTSKGPKSRGNTNADVIKNNLKAVQRSVSQLTKQQTAAQDGSTTNSTDDSSEATPKEASAKSPSNRTNAALTRQPKKASK